MCVSGRFFSFVPLRAAASRRERGSGSTLSVSYCLLLTCSVGSEEEADEEAGVDTEETIDETSGHGRCAGLANRTGIATLTQRSVAP